MLNYMGLSYNLGQVISDMQKGLTHTTHGCNNFLTIAEISTTNPPESIKDQEVRSWKQKKFLHVVLCMYSEIKDMLDFIG